MKTFPPSACFDSSTTNKQTHLHWQYLSAAHAHHSIWLCHSHIDRCQSNGPTVYLRFSLPVKVVSFSLSFCFIVVFYLIFLRWYSTELTISFLFSTKTLNFFRKETTRMSKSLLSRSRAWINCVMTDLLRIFSSTFRSSARFSRR